MKKIIDIEGIGEVYAKKLQDADIKSVEQLLEQWRDAQGTRRDRREDGHP